MKKKVKKKSPDLAIEGHDENHTGKRYFLFPIITACGKISIGGDHDE